MKKIDIVGIAFGNFKRRKLRSVLTVLGVVIGTASIVVMMSLGIAVDKSFNDSLAGMSDLTTVTVYPGWDDSGQQTGVLDDELVEKMKGLPNVEGVSPEINLNGKIIAGRYQWSGQIIGIDMSQAENYGFEYSEGAGFTDETVSSNKTVYMGFGYETPYQFRIPNKRGGGMMGGYSVSFGGGSSGEAEARPAPDVNIMDPTLRLRYTFDWSYGQNNPGDTSVKKKAPLYTVKPVGLLKESNNTSYNVYVDIETAKDIKAAETKFNKSQGSGGATKSNKETYESLKIFSDSMENTVAISAAVKEMGYQAWSPGEYLSIAKEQMAMIQLLLGGIGGVSLLVAAIGIANTMVMSIYERTREIGVMKVIGCYLKDIRTMFLVEAGFIGLFGGAVGMGLSYGLSALMNFLVAGGGDGGGGGIGGMMGMGGGSTVISIIPIWLTLMAVAFATLVAVISGFLPAQRAMKLSALEAMRV